MPSVLIVDDEANILSSLRGALGRENYAVDVAQTLPAARRLLKEAYDFVLLDVWFPEGSGLDLLREITDSTPDTAVVMMSGHANIDLAVQAVRLGAYDFLEKPVSLERLLILLQNASAAFALAAENRRLRQTWAKPIVGNSLAIRKLVQEIELAGPSAARVLIQGEHGTGKELVARALHAASPRRTQPFVAVNCSAIPEELFESELFGHEKGAFTGATQARKGRFEEAHLGTLFLDEVADLSPRAQTKLLRVLQEGEFTRVGGNRTVRADVRIVAATNRALAEEAGADRYREDLYFRLAVIPITVPPLRDRREDIPLLVEHFARELSQESGRRPKRFTPEALAALQSYAFPGNVRELRNLIERLLIMTPGSTIGAGEIRGLLPGIESTAEPAQRLGDAVEAFERARIEEALEAEAGSMTKAALRLGLERSHLYKKMKKLGIN
jgi:two-component system, NtrC family, nitrogen regulation response regulator NtrX